jgi:glycerol-3-phosphate O-acyltransferase
MDEVFNIVLEYPKLKVYLDENPGERKSVKSCVSEIKGHFNPKLVRGAIKFIDATFAKLYDGVNLEVPKRFDMNELARDNNVILVPNHQSHADYIALTYTIFGVYDVPIYIAGGINLNIFPIGKFFRNSGAFFIRRSFQDDPTYKIAFEAYIYYLLRTDKVVEFFFEGGRSRTGKLMKPRFGLFSMLLEAHKHIENAKPLMFIPVSLAHEHIPEGKSMARELGGAKKKPEKATQLLKLVNLFNKNFGTIHVRLSDPIKIEKITDVKQQTRHIAFEVFNSIGKHMPVTPSSLLSLIMLDEPTGAMPWNVIERKALEITDFCSQMNIPITPSLYPEEASFSLRKALDLYINNNTVHVIERERLDATFYGIKDEARVEMLYAKNMILHHFLVPGFINAVWLNIFRGEIKDAIELTRYLMKRRKELKYEFYLPSVKSMINQALKIVEISLGRKMDSLEETLKLDSQNLYKIASTVKNFSTAFAHIYEAYYIAATAVKYLGNEQFSLDKYISVAKELFEMEVEHGQIVKYQESYTVPKMKDAMSYFINQKVVKKSGDDLYQLLDLEKLEHFIEKFASDLGDQISISLKLDHIAKNDKI